MVVRISTAAAPDWVAHRLAGRLGTRWVGVDGLGAAGKSTLAARIAGALAGAVVVSVDDFARAGVAGWDRALFVEQVLSPLQAGRPGRYQRWDLVGDSGLDWVQFPAGVPVVVEGVSCTDTRVPVPWDVTLWVEAPEAVRRARILGRDAPQLLERWRTDWWPSEEAYLREQQPRRRVDAIVTAVDGGVGLSR